MKIKQFKVNRKYFLISIFALLVIIIAHYSYPYIRSIRLKREIIDLEKRFRENSQDIDLLQKRIDSLQKADDNLFEKIMHGDTVQTKK